MTGEKSKKNLMKKGEGLARLIKRGYNSNVLLLQTSISSMIRPDTRFIILSGHIEV
jgi:hypothetical protein